MILHTLNASPATGAFDDCLKLLQPGDAIIMMGDGVYAALEDTLAYTDLQATGAELYILRPDAVAAGILELTGSARYMDMDEFVALTERFPRQQAWY